MIGQMLFWNVYTLRSPANKAPESTTFLLWIIDLLYVDKCIWELEKKQSLLFDAADLTRLVIHTYYWFWV